MAEHLLRHLLAEHGVPEGAIEVRSGGIADHAREGSLVSLDARLALREVGIEIPADATARDLRRTRRDWLDQADLVLTMTAEQAQMVEQCLGRRPRGRLEPLRAFAGLAPGQTAGRGIDIEDPAGAGEVAFAAARDIIAHALAHALPRLVPGAPVPVACERCARERSAPG